MSEKPPPGSLEAVKATASGMDRYRAAVEYVERAETAARRGREVRDAEVRALVAQHGPAKVRRMTGLSLASVKLISRGVSSPGKSETRGDVPAAQ